MNCEGRNFCRKRSLLVVKALGADVAVGIRLLSTSLFSTSSATIGGWEMRSIEDIGEVERSYEVLTKAFSSTGK